MTVQIQTLLATTNLMHVFYFIPAMCLIAVARKVMAR